MILVAIIDVFNRNYDLLVPPCHSFTIVREYGLYSIVLYLDDDFKTDYVNTTRLVVKMKPRLVKPSIDLSIIDKLKTYELVLIITSDKEVLLIFVDHLIGIECGTYELYSYAISLSAKFSFYRNCFFRLRSC